MSESVLSETNGLNPWHKEVHYSEADERHLPYNNPEAQAHPEKRLGLAEMLTALELLDAL